MRQEVPTLFSERSLWTMVPPPAGVTDPGRAGPRWCGDLMLIALGVLGTLPPVWGLL